MVTSVAEFEYDERQDLTSVKTTIGSTDFKTTFLRGSDEDIQTREMLADADEVDFSRYNDTPRLPEGTPVNSFGVYSAGTPSELSVDTIKRAYVLGKEGSGVVNFARLWILWSLQNQTDLYYFGKDETILGTSEYVTALTYDPEDEIDLGAFTSDYYEAYTLDTEGRITYRPAFLFADLRGVSDFTPFVEMYNDFVENRGNGVLRKVRVLVISDHDNDIFEALNDSSMAYGFMGDMSEYDAVVVGEDEEIVVSVPLGETEEIVLDDFTVTFSEESSAGEVNFTVTPVLPEEFPSLTNGRGVLWMEDGDSQFEGWSRINTYLVPRKAWSTIQQSNFDGS